MLTMKAHSWTAKKLKQFRDARGWSNAKLAEELGASVHAVFSWLYRKHQIPLGTAKLLDCLAMRPPEKP